jgi:hypothetical protein
MGEAAQRPISFLWFLVFREKKGVHGRERLWECGNLALSARFPRDGGKRGKPVFGFPRFPRARHFHSFRYLNFGNDSVWHCRSNLALAALIRRAHSVSLITSARFSSSGKLNPGFKNRSASGSDCSFSNGVR